jgi:hypothetical protein
LPKPFILSTANASIDFTLFCGAGDSGRCCSTGRLNKHGKSCGFTQQKKENWKSVGSYNLEQPSRGGISRSHNGVYVAAQGGDALEEKGLRLAQVTDQASEELALECVKRGGSCRNLTNCHIFLCGSSRQTKYRREKRVAELLHVIA